MTSANENDKTINILNSVLKDFEENNEELNNLNIKNENLLNTISVKLINFAQKFCLEELENIKKFYDVSISDNTGFKFESKKTNNENKNNVDSLNSLERCIDRYTGLNKTITLYEFNLNETIHKNKECNRTCIESMKEESDEAGVNLKDCFNTCLKNYFGNSKALMSTFFKDLSNINNKI